MPRPELEIPGDRKVLKGSAEGRGVGQVTWELMSSRRRAQARTLWASAFPLVQQGQAIYNHGIDAQARPKVGMQSTLASLMTDAISVKVLARASLRRLPFTLLSRGH